MDQTSDNLCQLAQATSFSLARESTRPDSDDPYSDENLLRRFSEEIERERAHWRRQIDTKVDCWQSGEKRDSQHIETYRRKLQQALERTPEQMLASYRAEQRERVRAERQQKFERFIEERGARYANCLVKNYVIEHEGQKAVVDKLIDYGKNIRQRVTDGTGLLLIGPPGTGKDHLLVSLARAAIGNGLKIQWASGSQLFSDLRAAISSKYLDQEHQILQRLADTDVLYLSDLIPPSGRLTEFQSEFAFALIDNRYNHRRPTWFSANVASRCELETALSVPVVDRLVHGSIVLPCNWPSYRKAIRQDEPANATSQHHA